MRKTRADARKGLPGDHVESTPPSAAARAGKRPVGEPRGRARAAAQWRQRRPNGTPLPDGVAKSFTFLGAKLYVQTEILDGGLRTEVFLGERVIATREARLEASELEDGEDVLRERINEHHQSIIAGIMDRARSYRERGASAVDTEDEIWALPSPQPGSSQHPCAGVPKENLMAQINLDPLNNIDGFVGACIVDSDSGMMLGSTGGGPVDLELASAGNTQVVRAKRKTMESLKLKDEIEDILISLKNQYHLIRPVESNQRIFIYLVLDRAKSNLAMARHELRSFESGLKLG